MKKTKNMIFRKLKNSLFLLLIAAGMAVVGLAGLTGCLRTDVGECPQQNAASGKEVTITVNIPGQQIPTTRSIADAGGEAAVKTIDLLVFDGDDKLTEHVKGVIAGQSTVKTEQYKVTFKAALSEDATAKTLVILANAPAATITTAAIKDNTKAEVLTALTIEETGAWKTNTENVAEPVVGTDYTPIPMYGEVALETTGEKPGISAGMSIENIPLTRMLARIDVVLFEELEEYFRIETVYLVNNNTSGYIEPKWDGDKPELNDLESKNPVTTEDDAIPYAYSDSGLEGEIYTFEAAATSGIEGDATHTNAICLIVKGEWTDPDEDKKSGTYYYRIDFTGDNTDLAPEEVEYMPAYRNHLYRFDITAIDGSGYGTFDAALNSLGMLNNLKTTLHVIDEGKITNMAFNGQHYIGLGDAVMFNYDESDERLVPCTTNYLYGWQIDDSVYEGGIEWVMGDEDWLEASKIGDPADKSANIELKPIKTNIGASSLPDLRKANVHLVAGRLRHTLPVYQNAIYNELTVSQPASIPYWGGSTTFTVKSAVTTYPSEYLLYYFLSFPIPMPAAEDLTPQQAYWTAEYFVDGEWSTTAPPWLTSYPTYGSGYTNEYDDEGESYIVPETLTVTAKPQEAIVNYNDIDQKLRAPELQEKGSQYSPLDLSIQSDGKQSTANCYVINAPGYYKLPLVYGNARKDNTNNTQAYNPDPVGATTTYHLKPFRNHNNDPITSPYINDHAYPYDAVLVWMDWPGLVTNVRLVDSPRHLAFDVPKETIAQGNAVVAVRDYEGTILWSWHIWVTDKEIFDAADPKGATNTVMTTNKTGYNYSFMKYNLGWCTSREEVTFGEDAREVKVRISQTGIENGLTKEITIKQDKGSAGATWGNNPYWQFGRKDPMPPSNGGFGATANSGTNGAKDKPTMVYGEGFSYGAAAAAASDYGPSIQNPLQFYCTGSIWCTDQRDNLWSGSNTVQTANDNAVIKTVYDPNPVGFKMPAPNAWTNFRVGTTGGTPNATATTFTNYRENSGFDFYLVGTSGATVDVPAAGLRYSTGGMLYDVGNYGYYWSAGPRDASYGYYLYFGSGTVSPTYYGSRYLGFSVRAASE